MRGIGIDFITYMHICVAHVDIKTEIRALLS